MERHSNIDGVSTELLACLNSWPKDTVGYNEDEELIAVLNRLCKRHGYGRLPQLAAAIEEIWRDQEEGLKKWRAWREQHLAMLSGRT